ncbi:hypothetical protein BGZ61DRAFT_164689 [Ilyonectria robusta]|uniref:uncharacterized protein n=1 Tax=Ilyonectria robusta TaxID=1079257 RepID=UPI001E8E3D80|nr:uncharacterized protein BGZ61DRAFT_164689 [Ilyonectria robusta]KAH8733690.1 hypothetical protein BGZ61DRAFT_164689 [Ilyonectria robusta]
MRGPWKTITDAETSQVPSGSPPENTPVVHLLGQDEQGMDLWFTGPTKVAATTDTELASAACRAMDGLINNVSPRRKSTWFHATESPTMQLSVWRRGQSQYWLTSESAGPFVWGSMLKRLEHRWPSRNTNKGPITFIALPSAGNNFLPPNDEPENRAGVTLLVTDASMGHDGIPIGASFRITARIASTHRGLPAHQPTVTSHPQGLGPVTSR